MRILTCHPNPERCYCAEPSKTALEVRTYSPGHGCVAQLLELTDTYSILDSDTRNEGGCQAESTSLKPDRTTVSLPRHHVLNRLLPGQEWACLVNDSQLTLKVGEDISQERDGKAVTRLHAVKSAFDPDHLQSGFGTEYHPDPTDK